MARHNGCRSSVPTRVLDYAPLSVDELPAWFAGLSDDQLRRVWVSAIVEAHERCPAAAGELARALVAVRRRLMPTALDR